MNSRSEVSRPSFEYGSVVLAHAAPATSADWPEIMDRLVERLSSLLTERDGGGWELASHDFLISGEELIATFFIRRQNELA